MCTHAWLYTIWLSAIAEKIFSVHLMMGFTIKAKQLFHHWPRTYTRPTRERKIESTWRWNQEYALNWNGVQFKQPFRWWPKIVEYPNIVQSLSMARLIQYIKCWDHRIFLEYHPVNLLVTRSAKPFSDRRHFAFRRSLDGKMNKFSMTFR